MWDERKQRAIEEGGSELPRMLPLIRLKVRQTKYLLVTPVHTMRPHFQVDTTGATDMTNPVRFGQEFQGRIANPRDVLSFHRSRRTAKGNKVAVEEPELSIDDPDLTISEKLSKIRVNTLVKEYLAAQELQLLGEVGMSDAITTFVEKDDIHSIEK